MDKDRFMTFYPVTDNDLSRPDFCFLFQKVRREGYRLDVIFTDGTLSSSTLIYSLADLDKPGWPAIFLSFKVKLSCYVSTVDL